MQALYTIPVFTFFDLMCYHSYIFSGKVHVPGTQTCITDNTDRLDIRIRAGIIRDNIVRNFNQNNTYFYGIKERLKIKHLTLCWHIVFYSYNYMRVYVLLGRCNSPGCVVLKTYVQK
jgi:uncharacterized membrane protein YgcG